MSHSVYLFRHIQTNQVIVSTRQWAQNRSLRQLDTATRPVRLRKDHWRPLVAVTGFNSLQSAQAVSDALLQRSAERQLDFKTSPEHLARPKRLRAIDEKDLVEKSIVSLREAIEAVAPKHFNNETKLSALWEQPRFLEMKGEQEWPAFVEHGQLELKNNRFVTEKASA
ncbi:hypothetical protein BJV82DRAFT_632617 [Fennellomyces sp. T-0311]|nr:hypothetical protein BJV82DRAFT_632617 [Fennellomyces sp. T-0311]